MNSKLAKPSLSVEKEDEKDITLLNAKRVKYDARNDTKYTYFRVIIPHDNIDLFFKIVKLWRSNLYYPKLKDYVCYNNSKSDTFEFIFHMNTQVKLKVIKHYFGQNLVEAALDIQGNRGLDNFILSMDRNIDEYFKQSAKD